MSTLLFALLKWWAFSGLEKFRLFRWKLEMRLASPSSSTGNLGPFTVVKSRSTQSAAVTFEVPEKMILQGKFLNSIIIFDLFALGICWALTLLKMQLRAQLPQSCHILSFVFLGTLRKTSIICASCRWSEWVQDDSGKVYEFHVSFYIFSMPVRRI